MKIRMLKSMLSWKSYRNLVEGTVLDLPDEDAKLLISYGYAEPTESGGGSVPSPPPSSLTPTSPPSAPGREGGVEVASQREGGPVAVQAGGEPPSPAKLMVMAEEKKQLPDPKLVQWLEERGFVKSPDGRMVWSRVDQLQDGRIVRLVVDFEKVPVRGARYGYELDMRTGEWRVAEDLRDSHPLLLQFKAYRDGQLSPRPEVRVRMEEAVKEMPASEGQVLLQKLEQRDEEQIIAELTSTDFVSDVLRQYFYEFESRGRKVVGLSYRGVKQLALHYGAIEVLGLELKELENAWLAVAKARDKKRDVTVYGVGYQPKNLPDGSPSPFAPILASSKAQRNALRALIPETLIVEAYKRWLERREAGG